MKSITAKVLVAATIILAFFGETKIPAQTNAISNLTPDAETIEANQKYADTKKLIEILGLENTARVNFPKIIAALKPQYPQVAERFWNEFQSESNLQKYINFYTESYDRHFTHDDIKGMLQFYSTPLGQKIISTMPKLTEEMMDVGKKMGMAVQEKIDNETPATTKITSRAAQIRQIIIARGLNPDEWDISADGRSLVSKSQPQPKLPEASIPQGEQPTPAPLPPDVHYLVTYGDMICYCKEEPKPYGNGYKFKIYPSDVETTVAGNIQIIKIK